MQLTKIIRAVRTDYHERVADKRASISLGAAGAQWPPQISTASAGAAQPQPLSQVRPHTQSGQKFRSHCLKQELTPL